VGVRLSLTELSSRTAQKKTQLLAEALESHHQLQPAVLALRVLLPSSKYHPSWMRSRIPHQLLSSRDSELLSQMISALQLVFRSVMV